MDVFPAVGTEARLGVGTPFPGVHEGDTTSAAHGVAAAHEGAARRTQVQDPPVRRRLLLRPPEVGAQDPLHHVEDVFLHGLDGGAADRAQRGVAKRGTAAGTGIRRGWHGRPGGRINPGRSSYRCRPQYLER
jgi:hypothetical protein